MSLQQATADTRPVSGQSYLARLHAEHKARQKRLGVVKDLAEVARVERERKAAEILRIRREMGEELARRELSARKKNEARRRKEMWRASWVKMIELAEFSQKKIMETLRQKAVESAWELERLRLPTMKDIISEVAEKYGVTINDILSDRRTRNLAQPRFEVCWRARNETRLSLPQIGRSIGGRDHTTVLNAIRKYEAMRREIAIGKPAYSLKTRNGFFNPALIITDGAE